MRESLNEKSTNEMEAEAVFVQYKTCLKRLESQGDENQRKIFQRLLKIVVEVIQCATPSRRLLALMFILTSPDEKAKFTSVAKNTNKSISFSDTVVCSRSKA